MNKGAKEPQRSLVGLWLLIIIATLLLLSPFLFVSFPPSTDLPQHLGQIYLLTETLRGNTDLFSVNWHAPNNLCYLLLAANAYVFPAPLSGKMTMMILLLLWIGSVVFLAWSRGRHLEGSILAVLLGYNMTFYWGFLNFLIGWPVFVLWLNESLKPLNKRRWFFLFLLSILLYGSHALWFFIGSVWLILRAITRKEGWRSLVYGITPIVPVGIAAVAWYMTLSSAREIAGFDTAPHWFHSPWERLLPGYLVNSMFGGIKGIFEPLAAGAILGWVLFSIYTNRRRLKKRIDTPLLGCALMLTLIMLFAPEKYMNTIFFSQRWFPCAIILAIVALPLPVANRHLIRVFTLCVLVMFSAGTARAWYLFQQRELVGLEESLGALPRDQRVLGLSFVKTSEYLKGSPFVQTFAYAQVLKGGDLNFSFAAHASGIVRYKNPMKYEYTLGLEWFPEQVRYRDFEHFDYVLVNGDENMHARFSDSAIHEPVTDTGRWHLYKIVD
ncbi:MAG: hypothetical protein JSW58_11295 [Candidatus Latescibacterota bacterium]|nr:MAG: hypothetical protein JSW58_11295 [Candidatus Latescibacterota bacterium]